MCVSRVALCAFALTDDRCLWGMMLCKLHTHTHTHTHTHISRCVYLTATQCNSLQLTGTQCKQLHFKQGELESRYVQHCNSLQLTATHCNSLQLTATHCNSLQLTATLLIACRVDWRHIMRTAFPNTTAHCNCNCNCFDFMQSWLASHDVNSVSKHCNKSHCTSLDFIQS